MVLFGHVVWIKNLNFSFLFSLQSQDGVWLQQSTTPTTPSIPGALPQRPPSPSEPICLSDSLDEDLGGAPSLDSISQALALLSSAAKGLIQSNSPPSPEGAKPVSSGSTLGPASSMNSSTPVLPKKSTPNTTVSALPVTGGPIFASPVSSSACPSPVISRPPSVSISPIIRSDGMGAAKVGVVGLTQVQRHGLSTTQRPVATTAASNIKTSTTSPPKPRPPPTASPLIPPHKSLNSSMTTSPGFHKPGNNSSTIGRIGAGGTTQSSQSHATALVISSSSFSSSASSSSASSHLNAKTQPKISSSPSPSPSQPKLQQQSTFVTPMQATLTKSPHSSNSPILKLTPRVTPTSSPSPVLPRAPTLPSMHQFTPKSAGFHAGYSGAGYSTPVGQQKTPSQVNSSSLTSTSTPVTKHTSPLANHGPRQRPAGVANQGAKAMATVSSATAPQLAQVQESV